MRQMLAAALAAVAVSAAGADRAGEPLRLRDVPLAAALEALADAAGVELRLAPGLELPMRTTIETDGRQDPGRLLEALIRAQGLSAGWEDGALVVTGGDRPYAAAPARAAPRPEAPALAAAQSGRPTVRAKRYEFVPLRYAYAPGLAVALGGRALLWSDIDPWAAALSSGLGGGMGGVSGGGRAGAPAGTFAGGLVGAQTGQAVLELPEGIEELVGVDWLSGLVVR